LQPSDKGGTVAVVSRVTLMLSSLRLGALLLVGGLLVGLAAFWGTSQVPVRTSLGPPVGQCPGETLREPGFDIWTGEPHGGAVVVSDCFDPSGPTRVVTSEPPVDLVGRRAIPLPLGTLLGALLLYALMRVD
jgi:hypothetical protein